MKTHFDAYYRPTEEAFKRLWDTCILAFDTSVALHLYEFSQPTREDFLDCLTALKARIWMPHRAGYEYHRLRRSVISEQIKQYGELRKGLDSIAATLRSSTRHPFVSDPTLKHFERLLKTISKDLDQGEDNHRRLLTTDPILDSLTTLFDGRVGDPYPEEKIATIIAEGRKRYEKKIPPGYSDAKKPGETAYGDLIMWNQLLDHARTDTKGLIFVTNDQKEDWWLIHDGATVGPRPELIEEMKASASATFYMYRPETFLRNAKLHLGRDVKETTIKEVKEVTASRIAFSDRIAVEVVRKEPTPTQLCGQKLQQTHQAYEPGWKQAMKEENVSKGFAVIDAVNTALSACIAQFQQRVTADARWQHLIAFRQKWAEMVADENLSETELWGRGDVLFFEMMQIAHALQLNP